MDVERLSCAALSLDLEEPLAGTAALATGWICVEHPGPWTPKAPSVVELGEQAARLDALDDVRVQLMRPVRLAHAAEPDAAPVDLDRDVTVLLSHAAVDPAARWMRRLRLDHPAQLADVDPSWVLSSTPPPVGAPVEHDVWLVCAHGRRDACCAVRGRPVAMALLHDGVEVWETTHTGGHRFAATAVLLPDGLSLGRLHMDDPVATAAALAAGEVPAELLRGRCAVPAAAQAAEVALRVRLAIPGRDEVLPVAWETQRDGGTDGHTVTQVHLTAPGASWSARVRSGPVDQPRRVSDTAADTRPTMHTVVTLEPI